MTRFLSVICCVHSIFVLFELTQADASCEFSDGCPSPTNCPYGLDSNRPFIESFCYAIFNLWEASSGGCFDIGGYDQSIQPTDAGYETYGLATTPENVCSYFGPDDLVTDCFFQNRTLVINYCCPVYSLMYKYREECCFLYTFYPCEVSEAGQLCLDYLGSPDDHCALGPYIDPCEFGDEDPEPCPDCVVSPCPPK